MNFFVKIIKKTLLGLPRGFYIRNVPMGVFFAVCFYVLFILTIKYPHEELYFIMPFFLFILAMLYPYSIFLSDQIRLGVNKMMYGGRNVEFGNIISRYQHKFFTMMFCYVLSFFMTPICITYLYFYNTSNEGKVIDA